MINRKIIVLLLVCLPILVFAQKKDLQKLDKATWLAGKAQTGEITIT